MWNIARAVLCLGLSFTLWSAANAEPWSVAQPPDPPPTGTTGMFVPEVFSEFSTDGYWASGTFVQGIDRQVAALVRFDADGNQQTRVFDELGGGSLLKRLADGGVLRAASRTTDAPFPLTMPLCQIVRVTADGRTQWQTVLDGGRCHSMDIDAAGNIWVAIGTYTRASTLTIAQVLRLRGDGSVATRVAMDDPLLSLLEMRVDPASAGVFLAGHRTDPGNPQAGRARITRLRADGSVDWLWQSGSSAAASSIKHLRVSASAGLFAIGTRNFNAVQEKDWLAVGLSLAGVQRFEKKISFGKDVDVVGTSAPDAAGLWLAVQQIPDSETNNDRTVWVVRLSASGKRGSSHTIRAAEGGCVSSRDCPMALRRDGGLWLMVYSRTTAAIVGVDSNGNERARLAGINLQPMGLLPMGLLPDDRALGVTGMGVPSPINDVRVNAVRIGFGQPAEPWSQLTMSGRSLIPVEAVASDGAIAQWRSALPRPGETSVISSLTFRTSDTAPVAWRIEFPLRGEMQLSVSRSMVCMAGYLQDFNILHVLECRRRADGSVLWREVFLDGFEAITALDDGRAVAISGGLGSLQQRVIGEDGQILLEKSQSLLGVAQQELVLRRATFNAQGDALLIGFDLPFQNGSLLRLDHDGVERFRTDFVNDTPDNADINNQIAFADDGGAIRYGDNVIARYLPTGEKLWEIMPDRLIADLVVDGNTILYSRRSQGSEFPPITSDWEVVALDSANAGERWRLPLDAPLRRSAGIAVLAPHRLAVLQTESNHLRYREFDVTSGALLREQTDDCGGELCGCELLACKPRYKGRDFSPETAIKLQSAGQRLRARVDNFRVNAGWGSSVLELADAGQAPPTVRADQEGVSGAWYAPWSNGQGLMVDWIAGARTLFSSWLTFAPDGGNDPSGLRWYTMQGELSDPSPDAALDIMSNEGGRFGVGVTEPQRVGSARLVFESCDRAQFSYQFDPDENDGVSGLVTLSRLTPGGACIGDAAAATPPVASDAAIEGAWFDPASSGQGLMFNTIPAQEPTQSSVFATWFTYDTQAAPDDPRQQHWFTLQGPLASDGQSTLTIFRTIGGALVDGPTNNSQRVGTVTLTQLDCNHLRLNYVFDDSEAAGPFRRINDFRDLQRIGGCAD